MEGRAGLPEHLRGSSVVVEVGYGDVFETHNHTEPFVVGQVTFNFVPEMSYLWMLPPPRSSSKLLREARALWPHLRSLFSPFIVAHAKSERDGKFLRFFGFLPYAEHEGVTFFKEPSQ
jgi:hypothetical protein